MPMPKPQSSITARRFREVEAVKLFTSSGHPWMGLAALVVYRLPLVAGAIYLMVGHSPF